MVHHVYLTVANVAASLPLYECVLTFLGYERSNEDARGVDWEIGRLDGSFCSIGIKKSEARGRRRRHDRYSPGLHHLAWRAESRADVDRLYALLLRIGARILDAPADYPRYGHGYYAVFWADPDGLKLEYVHQDLKRARDFTLRYCPSARDLVYHAAIGYLGRPAPQSASVGG
jgi:catechol 2,3-dioxygenase-like lactoylglutathione lyase family enzyme